MRSSVRHRIFTALHYALRGLILLTPVLLIWHHFGMDHVFELSAASGHHFSVKDDRHLSGGSVATLTRNGQAIVMDCLLEKKYEWPFCDLTIQLAEVPDGINLSSYDSVTFDVAYTGPGPNFLRFYMRNYEEGISKPSDWLSMKVNGTEFEVPASGRINVPIRFFQVASWWLSEHKIPLLHSDTRIDKVPFVELSTGSLAKPGHHRIELKSIRFNGKWITQSHLAMALVAAWLAFGTLRLIMELLEFHAHLRVTKLRVAHLVTMLRAKRDKDNLDADAPHDAAPMPASPEPSDEPGNPAPSQTGEASQPDTSSAEDSGESAAHPPRTSYLRWISATVGNSLRLIAVDDIVYFQTDQKYTRVVLVDSEVLIKKSLKELLGELDPEQFWRIHRSIVINALEVVSIEPNIGGQLAVKLKRRREHLPVSDAFLRRVRQM